MSCEECDAKFKWNWGKFIAHKCSNKFLAWITSTAIIVWIIAGRKEVLVPFGSFEIGVMVVWGAVTVIFMLSGAIDTAVANAKITAELKAGVQKMVNTETVKGEKAI